MHALRISIYKVSTICRRFLLLLSFFHLCPFSTLKTLQLSPSCGNVSAEGGGRPGGAGAPHVGGRAAHAPRSLEGGGLPVQALHLRSFKDGSAGALAESREHRARDHAAAAQPASAAEGEGPAQEVRGPLPRGRVGRLHSQGQPGKGKGRGKTSDCSARRGSDKKTIETFVKSGGGSTSRRQFWKSFARLQAVPKAI